MVNLWSTYGHSSSPYSTLIMENNLILNPTLPGYEFSWLPLVSKCSTFDYFEEKVKNVYPMHGGSAHYRKYRNKYMSLLDRIKGHYLAHVKAIATVCPGIEVFSMNDIYTQFRVQMQRHRLLNSYNEKYSPLKKETRSEDESITNEQWLSQKAKMNLFLQQMYLFVSDDDTIPEPPIVPSTNGIRYEYYQPPQLTIPDVVPDPPSSPSSQQQSWISYLNMDECESVFDF